MTRLGHQDHHYAVQTGNLVKGAAEPDEITHLQLSSPLGCHRWSANLTGVSNDRRRVARSACNSWAHIR